MDINALTSSGSRSAMPSAPSGVGIGDTNFQDMLSGELARQKAAATVQGGRVPSAQEAQITAAQIAAQANVLGPLKRGPIAAGAGMNTQPTTVIQAVPGKFFPLHREVTAPQGQTVQSRALAPTSVEQLQASNKFAPGPVASNLSSAAQRFVPSSPAKTPAAATQPTTTSTAAAATISPDNPPWFNQALRNLDKYDAMKAQNTEH